MKLAENLRPKVVYVVCRYIDWEGYDAPDQYAFIDKNEAEMFASFLNLSEQFRGSRHDVIELELV